MKSILKTAIENGKKITENGKVATYIPELAKGNRDYLGACIFDTSCNIILEGDYQTKFTIQSVSKVIILICALIDNGKDAVFSKVGKEPSADAFNSMVKLEQKETHKPSNPFINAGAIVCTSIVAGDNGIEKFRRIHNMMKKLANNYDIEVNYSVYNSEKLTGNTNRAMAYYLKGAKIIENGVEDVLDAYFKCCSVEVVAEDIARIASVIANGGVAPWSNERIIPEDVNRIVKALMMTCGLYDRSGEFREKALGTRNLGIVFSILITISFGLIFNSVQANTVTFALEGAFGISRFMGAIILVVLTSLVIFGGVKRIAKVAEILVPVMAIAYILVSGFVILKNITEIPGILKMIFQGAFGIKQFTGGGIGAAIMMGIKRGLFSNEAGMGSAPNAAASADVSHPIKQGIVQVFGVFLDTIVICSGTAFIVLISGQHLNEELTGIELTQAALTSQVGEWGSVFIGAMALINILVIARLGKVVSKVLKDYVKQIKQGKDPVFIADSIEGLKNTECWNKD